MQQKKNEGGERGVDAYIGKELRKNASIVATAREGTDVRHAIEDSLLLLAVAAEDKEISLNKHRSLAYRNGILTGLGIAFFALAIMFLLVKFQQGWI